MHHRIARRARWLIPATLSLCQGLAAAQAASAPPVTPATPAKDIVLDKPAPAAHPVPTSNAVPPAAVRPGRAARDAASAAALAELALDLLRQQGETGETPLNSAVSPVSLAAALGLIHAGTQGPGARELAGLLGTRAAGERMFSNRLPQLLAGLQEAGGQPGAKLLMANRVWVDKGAARAIPAPYAALVQQRFQAEGAALNFGEAQAARQTINQWASEKTAQRIPELLPAGAVTPATRMVLTNALYFKGLWDKPFDAAKTAAKPFQLTAGSVKLVPTMSDERELRMAVIDKVTVMELPFAGQGFALLVAMPPEGQALTDLARDLEGVDLASWAPLLQVRTCRVELPKFAIAPRSQSLKPGLQALGVKAVFGSEADFSPLLGRAAKGVYLDNVYQSVSVTIDEQGGEAAAATAGTGVAKSFALPAPVCAVDRPFLFAIVHKPSGAPLFVGKVADPSQP